MCEFTTTDVLIMFAFDVRDQLVPIIIAFDVRGQLDRCANH